MDLEIPKQSGESHSPVFRTAVGRVLRLDKQARSFQIRVILFGTALILGFVLGALIVNLTPLYLFLGIGGIAFAFLVLFKIEIAVMLAILLRNELGQFNYLGGDTAMHPNGLMGVAVIGGAVFFFLMNRIDVSRLRGFWLFLTYSAITLVSLLWAGEYFMDGLTVVLRLLTALSIYAVLVYKLDSTKKINWLIGVIIASQVLPTVRGLISVARGGGMDLAGAEIVRSGDSGQGVLLAMILAFCLVYFLDASVPRQRLLWGGLTGFFAIALFFSYGRAGWIGFSVTALLIGLKKRSKLLIAFPIALVLLVVLVPTVTERFADIDLDRLDQGQSSTLAGRIEVWGTAAQVFETHPWLGVGYGTIRYRVGEYLAESATMAHNDYLAVLAQTGLIGLLVFLVWHGHWLVELLRADKTAQRAYDKTLALAVLAMFIASLVVRITDNVLESTDRLYPLVALVAATLALPQIRAQEVARSSGLDLSRVQPDGRRQRILKKRAQGSGDMPGDNFHQRQSAGAESSASIAAGGEMIHDQRAAVSAAHPAETLVPGQPQGDPSTLDNDLVGLADDHTPASTGISKADRKEKDLLTIARGGSLTFVGSVAKRGINYVYSTVLVWGLGAEDFGLFTIALAVTGFVGVIADLGMSQGIVRFGAIRAQDHGRSGVHKATMAALRVVLPMSLLFLIALLLSADWIAGTVFKKPDLAPLLRALGWSVPFMSLQSVFLAATRAVKVMKYTIAVLVVQALAALVLAVAVFAANIGTQAVALSFVVSHALGAGLAFYYYLKMIFNREGSSEKFPLGQMIKFSLPLSFNNWMHFANERTEVFFLGMLPSAVDAGIYNVTWRVAGLETVFLESFYGILSPFASDLSHRRALKQLESLYKTTTKWGFTGALALFLVFVQFSDRIMSVFDPVFVAGSGVLIALGFAQMINALTGPCGTVLIMSGRSDLSLFNTIVLFSISVALDWLLIPNYGLVGAAIAGSLAIVIINLLRLSEVWWTLRIQPFKWSFAKPIVAGVLSSGLVFGLRTLVPLESLVLDGVYSLILVGTYVALVCLLKLDAEDMLVIRAVRHKIPGLKRA